MGVGAFERVAAIVLLLRRGGAHLFLPPSSAIPPNNNIAKFSLSYISAPLSLPPARASPSAWPVLVF